MYYNKALNRINRVNWLQLGICKDKQRKGFEYLCRMAGFVEEQSIKPINPLFINIAKILGDEKEIDYVEKCSEETRTVLKNKCAITNMVNFYLQLAHYADENNEAQIYLQIYDPMIQLLEQGYDYEFREAGLMIYNVGLYPLSGWYERFIENFHLSNMVDKN